MRLVTGLRELPLAELRLDLPVEVVLERADGERLLPFVRPFSRRPVRRLYVHDSK